MTYAEAIKNSLRKGEDSGIYPICFGQLSLGLASLAIHLAQTLLIQDFPDVEVGGVKYSGKAEESPIILPVMKLTMGTECLSPRGAVFNGNYHKFVDWLLDQPIPDSDDNGAIIWYDQDTLINKWNEYAKIAINHNI